MAKNGCGESRVQENPSFKMKTISFFKFGDTYKGLSEKV